MSNIKIGQKVYVYNNSKNFAYKDIDLPENLEIIEGCITDIKYSIQDEIMHHDDHYIDFKPDKLHFTKFKIELENNDEIILERSYTYMKWSDNCLGTSKSNITYRIFFNRKDCVYYLRGLYIKAIKFYEDRINEYTECVNKIRKTKNKIN